jgi:AraC-like DNA-binding protein
MSIAITQGRVRNIVPVLVHLLPDATSNQVNAHACDELVYLVRGQYATNVSGHRLVLSPGDVVYYPQQTPHHRDAPLDYSTKLLVLQWQPEPGDGLPGVTRKGHDARGRLLNLLTWMLDLTPPGVRAVDDLRDVLLHALVADLRDLLGPHEGAATDPVARVQRWIAAHLDYRGGFLLDEMAAVAGMTPSQVSRAFKAATGETPTQCLQRLRVEAALPLILHTEVPMAEIAARVGLYDTSHLWRLVVRHTGRSPLTLRAEARQGSGAVSA